MRGSLRSTIRILRSHRTSPPDVPALQRTIGSRLGVDSREVFLTHGASEGNALVLFHLAKRLHQELGRAPTVRFHLPEYPPLTDVAGVAGFKPPRSGRRPDLFLASNPQNPTGLLRSAHELLESASGAPATLIDETFREFSEAPSVAGTRAPGRWVSGTMTKAFGADPVRVGWVVPPERDTARFRRFYDLVTDGLPDESVRMALDLFAESAPILREARGILRRNRTVLSRALPKLATIEAPICFDRPGERSTDALADRAIRAGVLISPGRFFGDPSGIRLGLTRRSFPTAFAAYLAVRNAPVRRGTSPRRSR
jgi:histidinol-phosphate/aromatic aminotransferase/cobyric acid decarboxylase-like protein